MVFFTQVINSSPIDNGDDDDDVGEYGNEFEGDMIAEQLAALFTYKGSEYFKSVEVESNATIHHKPSIIHRRP